MWQRCGKNQNAEDSRFKSTSIYMTSDFEKCYVIVKIGMLQVDFLSVAVGGRGILDRVENYSCQPQNRGFIIKNI